MRNFRQPDELFIVEGRKEERKGNALMYKFYENKMCQEMAELMYWQEWLEHIES